MDAEIKITFPGGKKVNATIGDQVISTDQPVSAGGDGSAPAPFALFLASIGTCAGIYVLSFLTSRGLPTAGTQIKQRLAFDPKTNVLQGVELEVVLPAGVPEKYHDAIVRAAESCAVKKAIQAQPEFEVRVSRLGS